MTQLPDMSTFADFVDAIHGYRERTENIVRGALVRIGDHQPPRVCQELADVSRELEGTFRTLDEAAEELRAQNEALFAARVELEGASALFRDLFELAPTSYVVTSAETRIVYANDAACALLRVPKNALVGKPLTCFIALEERSAFRAGVTRACESSDVSTWPTVLAPRNGPSCIACRLRVRSASTPGVQISRLLYWNITEESDEDLL